MRRLLLAIALLSGCGSTAAYTPRYVARGELTLRYDDRVEIYAGHELLTRAPVYADLKDYVRCVPAAKTHALEAAVNGRAGLAFAWIGGGLGVASLAGLAGLAFIDKAPQVGFTALGSGLAAAVIGIVFAATSRPLRRQATGHAVDALNYYNDAVGSYGGSCTEPLPRFEALPPVEGPRPAPVERPPAN